MTANDDARRLGGGFWRFRLGAGRRGWPGALIAGAREPPAPEHIDRIFRQLPEKIVLNDPFEPSAAWLGTLVMVDEANDPSNPEVGSVGMLNTRVRPLAFAQAPLHPPGDRLRPHR
jgi:hypothetical protein